MAFTTGSHFQLWIYIESHIDLENMAYCFLGKKTVSKEVVGVTAEDQRVYSEFGWITLMP